MYFNGLYSPQTGEIRQAPLNSAATRVSWRSAWESREKKKNPLNIKQH